MFVFFFLLYKFEKFECRSAIVRLVGRRGKSGRFTATRIQVHKERRYGTVRLEFECVVVFVVVVVIVLIAVAELKNSCFCTKRLSSI